MKRLRRKFPRIFPIACAAVGALAGWWAGVLAARLATWAGVAVLVAFVLVTTVVCAIELRDSRRRIAVLKMIQQAAATHDEDLLEVAYLQMKYLTSPGRRRFRRH